MSTANTYVRARIDTATKIRAGKALNAMGLTVSDAIRLLMLRIAEMSTVYHLRLRCQMQKLASRLSNSNLARERNSQVLTG